MNDETVPLFETTYKLLEQGTWNKEEMIVTSDRSKTMKTTARTQLDISVNDYSYREETVKNLVEIVDEEDPKLIEPTFEPVEKDTFGRLCCCFKKKKLSTIEIISKNEQNFVLR